MTDEVTAQRAYIKDISDFIPEFNGQKLNLQRFITVLRLVSLTKGSFEELAVEVIKSKIEGLTLYKVQNETTINGIIQKLQDTIVGESSYVVEDKMNQITQKGKNAEKFTSEIDHLRKLLEASYIDEGLSPENAEKYSTKAAITAIEKNRESILDTRRGQTHRYNTYRGNYRGRGRGNNQSNGYSRNYGNYQNNGYNQNYNNQNYKSHTNNNNRGRGYYRGNNRGGTNNNGNNNNTRRNSNAQVRTVEAQSEN